MSADDDLSSAMSRISISERSQAEDPKKRLKRKGGNAVSVIEEPPMIDRDTNAAIKNPRRQEKSNSGDSDSSSSDSEGSWDNIPAEGTGRVFIFEADRGESFQLPEDPSDKFYHSDDEEQEPQSPFKKVVLKVPALATPDRADGDGEGELEDCDIPVVKDRPTRPDGWGRSKNRRKSTRVGNLFACAPGSSTGDICREERRG